jgi:hypothetical protein
VPEIETAEFVAPDAGVKTNVCVAGDETVNVADFDSPASVLTVTV